MLFQFSIKKYELFQAYLALRVIKPLHDAKIKTSFINIKVNLVQAKIITDTSDPAYNTLENQYMMVKDKEAKVKEMEQKISRLLVHFLIFSFELTHICLRFSIRVVATTPRKDTQPNISDLRDHSQSIFRPILTRVKKKKKRKKVATPIY